MTWVWAASGWLTTCPGRPGVCTSATGCRWCREPITWCQAMSHNSDLRDSHEYRTKCGMSGYLQGSVAGGLIRKLGRHKILVLSAMIPLSPHINLVLSRNNLCTIGCLSNLNCAPLVTKVLTNVTSWHCRECSFSWKIREKMSKVYKVPVATIICLVVKENREWLDRD